MKIEPDALTYDRLMLVCLDSKGLSDLGDAWKYLEEMKGRGWWPRRGTIASLVKRSVEESESRVWKFLEECEERGVDVKGVRRWADERRAWMVERKEVD